MSALCRWSRVALAALFGCDGNGMNCDSKLNVVTAIVTALGSQVSASDGDVGSVLVATGRGQLGIAPR